MISGQEAQAKFNEFHEAQGSHDEVYTDGSKMNERVGAAAVINRHFQNGETTCRQLSKRLPGNSTIYSWGYSHQSGTELLPTHGPSPSWCSNLCWLNVLFAGNWGWRHREPFISHIRNLLWSLSDMGTYVRLCWVPKHCGVDGNERVDQLAK